MDRRWFAAWALPTFAAVFVLGYFPALRLLGVGLTLIWVVIYTRRLHDIGQSGWRQLVV